MPITIIRCQSEYFEDHLDSKRSYSTDESEDYDFSNLENQLSQAMQQKDIPAYTKLLLSLCTFKKKVGKVDSYTGGHHYRVESNYTCYTRPLIEYLFFENNDLFLKLIEDTLKLPQEFQDIFIEQLNKTDLKGMADVLSLEKSNKISNGLQALENYGKILKENKINRGEHAVNLVTTLRPNLTEFISSPEHIEDKKSSSKNKLECLTAKINFYKNLHSKDDEFVAHRGYKRIVANIVSLLFSAGIANLLNRCITGNWLFFNKTTTQELMDKLDLEIQSTDDFATLSQINVR